MSSPLQHTCWIYLGSIRCFSKGIGWHEPTHLILRGAMRGHHQPPWSWSNYLAMRVKARITNKSSLASNGLTVPRFVATFLRQLYALIRDHPDSIKLEGSERRGSLSLRSDTLTSKFHLCRNVLSVFGLCWFVVRRHRKRSAYYWRIHMRGCRRIYTMPKPVGSRYVYIPLVSRYILFDDCGYG